MTRSWAMSHCICGPRVESWTWRQARDCWARCWPPMASGETLESVVGETMWIYGFLSCLVSCLGKGCHNFHHYLFPHKLYYRKSTSLSRCSLTYVRTSRASMTPYDYTSPPKRIERRLSFVLKY